MNHFYTILLQNKFITPIWGYILDLIEKLLEDRPDKQPLLNLFTIYFSLIDDGNTTMSLCLPQLKDKWQKKIEAVEIMLAETDSLNSEQIAQIKAISNQCLVEEYLAKIRNSEIDTVIGPGKIFVVEDNWLYLRKYNSARKNIAASIKRLFTMCYSSSANFDYRKCTKENFSLSEKQKEAVEKGIKKNLIITGGPGTGKTTCVLFLLLSILTNQKTSAVYLVAPSGKAASRMKESIISTLDCLTEQYKEENQALLDIVAGLQPATIHRLLEIDNKTACFSYNRSHQFSNDSIFIIDEASMIDICLFSSLLESIPDSARVFIMGDKNQLPSVDCGAVFSALLQSEYLIDNENIVELDQSRRFSQNTEIFALASAVNNGQLLTMAQNKWANYLQFVIEQTDKENCPIYYYQYGENPNENKQIIAEMCTKWAQHFYRQLQQKAINLKLDDDKKLDELFDLTLQAKILAAENLGYGGVRNINNMIKNICIDKSISTDVLYQYPGQLMMINKNNRTLDLYNGDSGIIVTIQDSNTAFFMIKKTSLLYNSDGYKKDSIFKLGSYLFYPLRLINQSEIDLAYAITIHKSQGSDYDNILVILPSKLGHPLLNRQIVYTAITRTKGNTYILASQDLLQKASDNLLSRDCNIF